MSDEFRLYSTEQVAELTGMSVDWLWRQCRKGAIPHHRMGREYRFSRDNLRQLMAQTAVQVVARDEDELVPAGRRGRR